MENAKKEAKPKKFYIVKAQALVAAGVPMHEGALVDVRKKLDGDEFSDGQYLILEDTSGILTKRTETVSKSTVEFEVPESRKRQRKTAPAVE